MNPPNLLKPPVVQDLTIALALNPFFREAETVRQTRSEILGDLQRFRHEVLGVPSISASSRPVLASSSDLWGSRSRKLAAARIRGIESDLWGVTVDQNASSQIMELAALRVHGVDEIRGFFHRIEEVIGDLLAGSHADTKLLRRFKQANRFPSLAAIAIPMSLSGVIAPIFPWARWEGIVVTLMACAVFNLVAMMEHLGGQRSWSTRADRMVGEIDDRKQSWWIRGSYRKLYHVGHEHLGRYPTRTVTMGDLLRAAEYEQIRPWVHPRMGFPVRTHLYVDQVLGRDAASDEPVMILTARSSTAPLKYAPEAEQRALFLSPATGGRAG